MKTRNGLCTYWYIISSWSSSGFSQSPPGRLSKQEVLPCLGCEVLDVCGERKGRFLRSEVLAPTSTPGVPLRVEELLLVGLREPVGAYLLMEASLLLAVPLSGGVSLFGGVPLFGRAPLIWEVPLFEGVFLFGGVPLSEGVSLFGGVPVFGGAPLSGVVPVAIGVPLP